MALLWDIETDGLLEQVTRLHCITIHDTESGRWYRSSPDGRGPVQPGDLRVTHEEALAILAAGELIVGHNIIAYDIPVLRKLYPEWSPTGVVRDTLTISRLIWTNLQEKDGKFRKRYPDMPGYLVGGHSLEAWGWRLGEWKGDYSKEMKEKGLDPWAEWNVSMDDYCRQDVQVTLKLWALILSKDYSEEAIQLEHDVAPILLRQEHYGFGFNEAAAEELVLRLTKRRLEIEADLQVAFPPWQAKDGKPLIPKRDNKAKGYVKGVPFQKWKTVIFNPASRAHIEDRLKAKYGWKPKEFTDNGSAKIDEKVLKALKYPESALLCEYLLLEKRLGQVSDGKQAWLKVVRKGRIHGRVNQNGAVTGRMTHMAPNVAQVPKCGVPYGSDCRGLFGPANRIVNGIRKVLVGADASGLELRCLAHYMAKWDHGEYAKVILEGDIHTVNQTAAGLPTRDNAKTFIYAFLYGAGDQKIGSIIGKGRAAGKALKQTFLKGLPALGKLLAAVESSTKRGYLRGLDGRHLHVRSAHSALNTLLQSAGALVMKKALVILDSRLQARGYVPGEHYEFCANVHDEWQIECNEDIAEEIGRAARAAIRAAGDHFGFRCPLDGEHKVGSTWAETH
ncbi:DNA polymerase [Coralloluteibacterium stylophorae]|uniref:DNA polymerase I n=1 Tax=Coralloluteibacterium stylophorae TaxID=1776034 RepID=A0A8J8AWX8_9GAMM|nr:DNA polymerase [Coralloluteibacterium stylophorae]MBS7457680.1 DNA polymerase [Coralloluteibacterium stylophorae]